MYRFSLLLSLTYLLTYLHIIFNYPGVLDVAAAVWYSVSACWSHLTRTRQI